MGKLISNRCSSIQSVVPESYILPPESRSGTLVVPPCKTIPVIDLGGGDRNELIRQIIKAGQEHGFFQLINHGVSEVLMKDVLVVTKEFFDLPVDETERFFSDDPNQSCRVNTSADYVKEKVHFWRDNLRLICDPLEDHIHHWPENPAHFREVFGPYSLEVRNLSLRLLDLICEGLGLESGYFREGLRQGQLMLTVNYYPPCPDPTVVLGMPKHADPYFITLLNQGEVPGLQFLKDEQWVTVEPLLNAFVVNINDMLQVVSNGKLKSVDHRAVVNSNTSRTSIVSYIRPAQDTLIQPANSLITGFSPPLYKSFTFGDYGNIYFDDTLQGKNPLERFTIRNNVQKNTAKATAAPAVDDTGAHS